MFRNDPNRRVCGKRDSSHVGFGEDLAQAMLQPAASSQRDPAPGPEPAGIADHRVKGTRRRVRPQGIWRYPSPIAGCAGEDTYGRLEQNRPSLRKPRLLRTPPLGLNPCDESIDVRAVDQQTGEQRVAPAMRLTALRLNAADILKQTHGGRWHRTFPGEPAFPVEDRRRRFAPQADDRA